MTAAKEVQDGEREREEVKRRAKKRARETEFIDGRTRIQDLICIGCSAERQYL